MSRIKCVFLLALASQALRALLLATLPNDVVLNVYGAAQVMGMYAAVNEDRGAY
jgi:hypothetical protein